MYKSCDMALTVSSFLRAWNIQITALRWSDGGEVRVTQLIG